MINQLNHLITALQDIVEEEPTIYLAIGRIETEIQTLRATTNPHNDRDRAHLKLWEAVLQLMQKPEIAKEEREINFEEAAHAATYVNPDDFIEAVADPMAAIGPDWEPFDADIRS